MIISDIHDHLLNLEKALRFGLNEKIQQIIFCGDLVSPFTLRKISEILPSSTFFRGVFGNNEGDKLTIMKFIKENILLKEQPLFTKIGDLNSVIIHGSGSVEETEKIALSLAKSLNFDLIFFGHTHLPKLILLSKDTLQLNVTDLLKEFKEKNTTKLEFQIDLSESVLILNPGELCGWLTGYTSYAILRVDGKRGSITYYGYPMT